MVDEFNVPGHDGKSLGLKFNQTLFIRSCKRKWVRHLAYLSKRPTSYLEIGVFEGHSFCWVLRNLLQHPESRAVGIDAWDGSLPNIRQPIIMEPSRLVQAEALARENVAKVGSKGRLVKVPSALWMAKAIASKETYDLIYIDGSHALPELWADSGLAWRCLAEGGVMVWDDYNQNIRKAVDVFVDLVGAVVVWRLRDRQLAVRKESLI